MSRWMTDGWEDISVSRYDGWKEERKVRKAFFFFGPITEPLLPYDSSILMAWFEIFPFSVTKTVASSLQFLPYPWINRQVMRWVAGWL